MAGDESTPRSPLLDDRLDCRRGAPRVQTKGILDGGLVCRKGVGLAEPKREVVGGLQGDTVECRQGADELVERGAAIEPDGTVERGLREAANCLCASRRQAEAVEVCLGEGRRRGKRVSEPERDEPRDPCPASRHQPAGDRIRSGGRELLPDDRPHTCLERIPGSRRAETGPSADQRRNGQVLTELMDRLLELEVEVCELAGLLHDVQELAPMGQVGANQQVVRAASRELQDAGVAADEDGPAIGLGRDLLDARDRIRGEVREQCLPIERAAERQPEEEAAVRDEAVGLAAPCAQRARRFAKRLAARTVELPKAAEAGRVGDLCDGQIGVVEQLTCEVDARRARETVGGDAEVFGEQSP
jgi:hypothetical protein